MENKTVDVIIPAYHPGNEFATLIKRLEKQTVSIHRIIVMNKSRVMFDDAPKMVFRHYKELEEVGLAAPQITYIMHALSENGLDVDPTATTVEEAKETILAALKKQKPSLLKKGGRSE